MKKGLLLLLVALVVSMILPSITLLATLNTPPTDDWSNAVDVALFPDRALRKYYPVALFKHKDAMCSVHIANDQLSFQSYTAMGLPDSGFSKPLDIANIWSLNYGQIDDNHLALYLKTDKKLYYTTLDLVNRELAPIKDIANADVKVSSDKDLAVLYDREGYSLYRAGVLIERFDVKAINALKIAVDGDWLHIAYNQPDLGGYTGRYVRYHLTKKQLDVPVIIFDNATSDSFGVVRQIKVDGDYVGIVYSKTVIQQQVQIGYISAVILQANTVAHIEHVRDRQLQTDVLIQRVTDDALYLISLQSSRIAVDYFRWNTRDGFQAREQLTQTRQSAMMPTDLQLPSGHYFYWLDLTAEGKQLRMASDNPAVVAQSKQPSAMDIVAVPTVLVFTGLLTLLATYFFPLLMLDILLIIIVYYVYKHRQLSEKQRNLALYIMVSIHLVYMIWVAIMILLPQLSGLQLSAFYVDNPIVAAALFVVVVALSIVIARFIAPRNKTVWYAAFTISSILLLCVNYGLYRTIDLMKFKF